MQHVFFSFHLCRIGTKFASVDNRVMLGISLLCALTGSAFVSDWQAIGHDPCSAAPNSSITDSMFNDSYYEAYYTGDLLSQFSIGALLIASSASLGFVFISAVTSEITSVESQVYYTYIFFLHTLSSDRFRIYIHVYTCMMSLWYG